MVRAMVLPAFEDGGEVEHGVESPGHRRDDGADGQDQQEEPRPRKDRMPSRRRSRLIVRMSPPKYRARMR
jgi:hypothetical protein